MCYYTYITHDCGHTYQTSFTTGRDCYYKLHEPVFGMNVRRINSPVGELCSLCEEKHRVIMRWMEGIDRAWAWGEVNIDATRVLDVSLFSRDGRLEEWHDLATWTGVKFYFGGARCLSFWWFIYFCKSKYLVNTTSSLPPGVPEPVLRICCLKPSKQIFPRSDRCDFTSQHRARSSFVSAKIYLRFTLIYLS